MNKDASKAKFIISFSKFLLLCYWMILLVRLQESSGGRTRSFPLSILFRHGSPCSYSIWGMNNRPVGGCSSETLAHPIDRNNNCTGIT
jgi:hypothetical protein